MCAHSMRHATAWYGCYCRVAIPGRCSHLEVVAMVGQDMAGQEMSTSRPW